MISKELLRAICLKELATQSLIQEGCSREVREEAENLLQRMEVQEEVVWDQEVEVVHQVA